MEQITLPNSQQSAITEQTTVAPLNIGNQKPASSKWLVLLLVAVVAIVFYFIGRNSSGIAIPELISTATSSQSPYEKCMYKCMEGKTETIQYCRADLKDHIDNYDSYYSPAGVSSAFTKKYGVSINENTPDKAYKLVCFLQVVACRKNLCEDYL